MPAVRGEEDVGLGAFDVRAAAEDRDHAGHVAVADVVLAAVRSKPLAVGREDHVGGVDVRAVRLLRQSEREHTAVLKDLRRARLRRLVVALPDRAETQDGDLPCVPVTEAVERQHLAEGADTGGVPATAL